MEEKIIEDIKIRVEMIQKYFLKQLGDDAKCNIRMDTENFEICITRSNLPRMFVQKRREE